MIRVYLVTTERDEPGAVEAALRAFPPGVAGVQLRAPSLAAAPLLERARKLLPPCRAAGAPLLVNDRADVALAAGADGVHLPARGLSCADARALLGRRALIAKSCHTPKDVLQASQGGADFCVFGAVFDTPGKPAQGTAALSAAARAAPLPVLALGGIDAANAASALAAGAAGVACIRAVLGAPDPFAAAAALWKAVSP